MPVGPSRLAEMQQPWSDGKATSDSRSARYLVIRPYKTREHSSKLETSFDNKPNPYFQKKEPENEP